MYNTAWKNFKDGKWSKEIDVRDFIQLNYTPYEGDGSFLVEATENTNALMDDMMILFKKERDNGGTLDVDTKTVSAIDAYKPGYIDKEKEVVVGLQTDEPLKRGIMPYGGIRMVETSCKAYGFELVYREIAGGIGGGAESGDAQSTSSRGCGASAVDLAGAGRGIGGAAI